MTTNVREKLLPFYPRAKEKHDAPVQLNERENYIDARTVR